MRRVLRGALCGAAAALLAMAGVSRADDSLRVAKGASRAYSFMLLDVGLAAGIFKKHNLNIEESSIDGAARLHQAMVANSIDIALGAGTDIAFIAKGSPEKGVGVMATDPLNMALTVRADSPIKNMGRAQGQDDRRHQRRLADRLVRAPDQLSRRLEGQGRRDHRGAR
jgi:ABC-type nitrate/sulfonate/bicarbonate transport system substrate-binding protein